MSRPNWAFFGGKEQGARVLNALAGDGFLPAFIVLLTESSPQEVTQFEGIARQLKVKFVPEQEMSSCLGELAKLDLGLTCRFSLLKEAVFSLPRLGSLNIHSSLLPS